MTTLQPPALTSESNQTQTLSPKSTLQFTLHSGGLFRKLNFTYRLSKH